MPVVTIVPKSKDAEEQLAKRMGEVRSAVRKAICDVSGFPENDVLVNLASCTMRDADPAAVNYVLYADTCPHEDLEPRADELRDKIAQALIDLGLTGGTGAEVWGPRFMPGSWCWVKHGRIVDSVSHPRTPAGSLEPFFEFQKDQFWSGRIVVKRRCLASMYAMQMLEIRNEQDMEVLGKEQVEAAPRRIAVLEELAQRCQRRLNLAGLGDL